MAITRYNTQKVATTALVDVALVALACAAAAASHAFAVPLYKFNPMLAFMLVGIIVHHDWRNGLILALLLPAVSHLVVGMPTADKMVCMMVELSAVATAFGWLRKRWATLPAVLTAIAVGKAIYYALSPLIVAPTAQDETEWWIQVVVALAWGGLFALLYKEKR